jgi:hypothetical protein
MRTLGITRCRRALPLLFLLFAVSGCKTSDDGKAASGQMAKASKDLSAYYATLDEALTNTDTIEKLQQAIDGTPYSAQDAERLKALHEEISKRAAMAKAMSDLSDAFAKYTGSTGAQDISDAASNLGTELVAIKALPKGPPIPQALDAAGRAIAELVQTHKEREMAVAMASTLAGVEELFSKEKPLYEQVYEESLKPAAIVAREMVERGYVDKGSLLDAAMQPFGLQARIVGDVAPQQEQITAAPDADACDTKDTPCRMRAFAIAEIKHKEATLVEGQSKASDAMEQALTEMTKRMHQLATEKTMSIRTAPPSLDSLEQWLSGSAKKKS